MSNVPTGRNILIFKKNAPNHERINAVAKGKVVDQGNEAISVNVTLIINQNNHTDWVGLGEGLFHRDKFDFEIDTQEGYPAPPRELVGVNDLAIGDQVVMGEVNRSNHSLLTVVRLTDTTVYTQRVYQIINESELSLVNGEVSARPMIGIEPVEFIRKHTSTKFTVVSQGLIALRPGK